MVRICAVVRRAEAPVSSSGSLVWWCLSYGADDMALCLGHDWSISALLVCVEFSSQGQRFALHCGRQCLLIYILSSHGLSTSYWVCSQHVNDACRRKKA